MRFNYLKIIISYWLIGLLVLLLGRVGLVALFIPVGEIMEQSQFLWLGIWNALRFDFQSIAYVAALPTVVFVVASHMKRDGWAEVFARYYYAIAYTLIATLTVCDLGFYKNFGEHFNVTVFDFFNEGPLTLVQTFWEEYPVMWMLFAVVAVFLLIRSVRLRFVLGRRSYASALALCAFIFVAMRGSVAEFPLQVEDMYVSPSQQFNDCVPNALYSLKKAYKEKQMAFEFYSDEALLQQYGFQSMDEAWDAISNADHELFCVASDTVVPQPDIVVILSESWSGYLTQLGLERNDVDLLCGMRRHLTEDILMQNYQSVHNGTIATIENLLLSTSFPRVFMSKYRYTRFPTSFASPFIQSGYDVNFISGMDEGWENVGIGLKTQGFKTVFKSDLLKEHPEYTYNSVGVYDHHLMNSLYEHLCRPSAKPRLFVVMTTTNHPPFVLPDDVKLPALPDRFYDNPAFANKPDIQKKYIQGFQYANFSMSSFLDRLKSSPASANTLVVITGDHNVRTALEFGSDGRLADEKWRYRVPLYICLPETLRGTHDGSCGFNTELYGCHYDIVATLAPFAFRKGVRYLNVGQNLLCDTLTRHNTYSYNTGCTQADAECSFDAGRRALARELLLRVYLQRVLSDEDKTDEQE